ncbi:NfeD family protein [Massilia sp. CF038]|uniref:NfeD family protein n=1 Tax=Massilia sp. CF038 TaxID=1881045 RepID=UPI00091253E1|nr:NfeD family protein [Massilia sp. CF038]SHG70328.1 Membrane protein implicated in regulation of membrane protease activity [Massilia sp. CF038]
MTELTGWLVLAGVLVVFELFTGTFYVLMIAIGMAFGAIAAALGFSLPVQVLVAAVVGVLSTGILHRSRFGRPLRQDAARDPNVNIDIGQVLHVDTWNDTKARAMYRGALWDVELAPGAIAGSGNYKIVELRGSHLVVANA